MSGEILFNLLRGIGIDIIQTTMVRLTLYLFPFSIYKQKPNVFTKMVAQSFHITDCSMHKMRAA